MVVLDNVTTWDVGLTHERLSRNNPSTFVFLQHPNFTHRHILSDAEYDEVQDLTQFQITGLTTIEILQEEFLLRALNLHIYFNSSYNSIFYIKIIIKRKFCLLRIMNISLVRLNFKIVLIKFHLFGSKR